LRVVDIAGGVVQDRDQVMLTLVLKPWCSLTSLLILSAVTIGIYRFPGLITQIWSCKASPVRL
jgi:hypothetical protein